MSPTELWRFFPFGFLFSILIETPVLLIGLSNRHPIRRRLFAGIWLGNRSFKGADPAVFRRWVLRLDDAMRDLGDVLVRLNLHGVSSNRVRLGIGHLGDARRSYPSC